MTIGRPFLILAFALLLAPGCRQQMARQPSYRPLVPSNVFPDQRSARPVIEGTVPRGELQLGAYYTGRKDGAPIKASTSGEAAKAAALVGGATPPVAAVAAATEPAEVGVNGYVDELPVAPEKLAAVMRRGQERFNIFCAPCHDRAGTGHGMIVERGFTPPPSFHTDKSRGFAHKKQDVLLRDAPVGYYFEVITQGYGAMPSYRAQIPADDRWAIVAYVRALQASQNATLADVPEAQRKTLEESRGRP